MAQSNKEALVALLRDLARQIQSLEAGEVDDVLAGAAKLHVRVENGKRPRKTKPRKPVDDELQQVARDLRELTTREEGEKLLDERASSKDDMVRLARILDLPVQKSDTVQQLRSRLIESTIGFRLRSAAIQGTSAKSPASEGVPDTRAM